MAVVNESPGVAAPRGVKLRRPARSAQLSRVIATAPGNRAPPPVSHPPCAPHGADGSCWSPGWPSWVGSAMFCSPGYIVRAGIEEAKILGRRQPIDAVIAALGTDAATRSKLELVRSVRAFADRELALDVGNSYTAFYAGRPRHAAPRTDRRAEDVVHPLHLVVSRHLKPSRSLPGILRPRRRPRRRPLPRRAGLRHRRPPLRRVQHPRLVQRPAPQAPSSATTTSPSPPPSSTRSPTTPHSFEGRVALQRELRQLRG